MTEFPPIESFGNRIMVCGPSNAGKSTLAVALGQKLGLAFVHLDQLHHVPASNWVARPREEFVALHDEAIARDNWVMDGNYQGLFPKRLARTTGIILLTDNRWAGLVRYFRRTWFQRDRAGALEGNRDSIKWQMIHWIMFASPPKIKVYRDVMSTAGVPFIEVNGMPALRRLYTEWGLTRK